MHWELRPKCQLILFHQQSTSICGNIINIYHQQGFGCQIRWIRKKSKRLSTPPPSFSEHYIAIVYDRYGCLYARRYEGQIVWTACTCLLQSVSCLDFSQYNCWKKHILNPEFTILYLYAIYGYISDRPKIMFKRMTIRRQLVIRGVLFEVVVVVGGKSIVLAE